MIMLLTGSIGSHKSYASVNFELPIDYLLEEAPAMLHPADYDGDGDMDLAVVHSQIAGTVFEEEAVSIHLNNGNGTYDFGYSINITEAPISITSADFDTDGDIDLATANTGSDSVSILLNDGSGSFTLGSTLEAGLVPGAVTSTDFDNDGDIDLAVAIYDLAATPEEYHGDADSSVVFYANDGVSNFTPSLILPLPSGETKQIISTDVNGDSIDDIIINSVTIVVLQNSVDTTFSSSYVEIPTPGEVAEIEAVDMDNDDDIDIIASKHGNESDVNIVLNDGLGNFNYNRTFDIEPGVDSFVATDLDNDEDIDLVIPTSDAQLYTFQQDNPGNFILLDLFDFPYLTSRAPVISTDLNGDGKNDLAFGNGDGEIFWVTLILQSTVSNNSPILDQIGNQVIGEGQTLEFTISATDPDNDTLTYASASLPPGATFNPATRVFSWTPGYNDAGNYTDVEFSVTDNGTPMKLDVELITISVGDVNRAPKLTNPGPQEVLENTPLSFGISATDPDDDTVSIIVANLPTEAMFDGSTFTWTPTLAQEGIYTVAFTATDNGAPNELSLLEVIITVGDNPTPTEQAEDLIETVITIDIPQNVENSYLANLQKVEQFILAGKIQAALNQLHAFINKVNQDYQQNILTQEERDDLVGAAEGLIADLTNS